ncbi:MAG TPA: response regulator transcription factor [Dissulfurispiraceae bacterium]
MKILIRLGSRLFSELLCGLLEKQKNAKVLIYDDLVPAGAFTPDIVLVDFGRIDGEFRAMWPEAKFLLIDTGAKEEEVVRLLLIYKIHGIISTNTDIHLFKKALKAIHDGQIWIDNSSIKVLLHNAELSPKTGQFRNVSRREKDIIDLICQGCTNKEIASKIFVSEQTVKAHLNRIYKKLNVASRSQVVALAMKQHYQVE